MATVLGLTTLAGVLLAACGPLPRPFRPEEKTALAVPGTTGEASVLVEPVAGQASGDPAAAQRALTSALGNHNIQAAGRTAFPTHVVSGQARLFDVSDDREALEITWRVRRADGPELGSFLQRSTLPKGLWSAGHKAALGSVMARAAGQLAELLPAPATPASAPAQPQALVVLPLEDAPGDGAISLQLALRRALRSSGYAVSDQVGANDVLILGDVTLRDLDDTWQEFTVTWFVVAAEDGADLGQIDQQNRVPAGSLDGPWGATAQAIASGAAEGIADLLGRLQRG